MSRIASRTALTVAAALAAFACRDTAIPTTPRGTPPAPPRAQISDGAHGGNAHFYFLPPLVANPHYSGESDDAQSPTVVVCEWNTENGGSCGAIVAQFGRGDGSAPDHITYDATAGQYQVNWKTDQCADGPCALDVAKTYRLRVLVGAYEVGHADLDVVSGGKELKNVQTGEYVGLVDGRTLPIKFRIEKGAVSVVAPGTPVTIGAAGGVLATDDGMVTLQFPAGALTAEQAITVKAVTEELPGVGEWAAPVDLGPDGATFDKPVTLTLAFDGSKLPPGIPPGAVTMFVWRDGSWEPVDGSVTNVIDNSVSAPISHFSTYVVTISPNYMSERPPGTLYVGDVTALTGFTTAYGVRADTHCRSERVQKRFLFWKYWTWTTRCYTVYTPYQYYPVGQRVYWTARPRPDQPAPYPLEFATSRGYTVIGEGGATSSEVLLARRAGRITLVASVAEPRTCSYGYCVMQRTEAWSAEITVLPRPVASVTVTPAATTILLPFGQLLFATLRDDLGNELTGRAVTWTTSDERVAIVSQAGYVVSQGPGTAIITATSEGKSGSATVTVRSPTPQYVFTTAPWGGSTCCISDIAVQRTDGSEGGNLTNTPSLHEDAPHWSPDGTRIVFSRGANIYVMNADGSGEQQLTFDGNSRQPSFSPDGSKIVFSRNFTIWVMNANGSSAAQWGPPGGNAVWSPDGKTIAFERGVGFGYEIFLLDVDPTKPPPYTYRQLTALGGSNNNPSWSPDGGKIAFASNKNIRAIDVASRAITPLTSSGADYAPSWSPDGSKIIFSTTRFGQWEIMLMGADGLNVQRLTNTPDYAESIPSIRPGNH